MGNLKILFIYGDIIIKNDIHIQCPRSVFEGAPALEALFEPKAKMEQLFGRKGGLHCDDRVEKIWLIQKTKGWIFEYRSSGKQIDLGVMTKDRYKLMKSSAHGTDIAPDTQESTVGHPFLAKTSRIKLGKIECKLRGEFFTHLQHLGPPIF